MKVPVIQVIHIEITIRDKNLIFFAEFYLSIYNCVVADNTINYVSIDIVMTNLVIIMFKFIF